MSSVRQSVVCTIPTCRACLVVAFSLIAAPWAEGQQIIQLPDGQWQVSVNDGEFILQGPAPAIGVNQRSLMGGNLEVITWQFSAPTGTPINYFGYAFQLGNDPWSRAKVTQYQIQLKSREFIPNLEPPLPPNLNDSLIAGEKAELFLVQFITQPLEIYRQQIRDLGGTVYSYIPQLAHIVRMSKEVRASVEQLPFVRWVGPMHPFYKLDEAVRSSLFSNEPPKERIRYLIESADKQAKTTTLRTLTAIEAPITERQEGTRLVAAGLVRDQVLNLAAQDSVVWIELVYDPEDDSEQARVQGGANYLELQPQGYTGQGIRGHLLEGLFHTHDAIGTNSHRDDPTQVEDGNSTSHGTKMAGVIFSHGSSEEPEARGMLPNAQALYTHRDYVRHSPIGSTAANSRYGLVKSLRDSHRVMFQAAAWGEDKETVEYTGRSQELDDITFELDLPTTQSQGNEGNRKSRAQAWAKNVISVGAVKHHNNSDRTDDVPWPHSSHGPAEVSRVKPDLVAFGDSVSTTNGSASFVHDFGGTSSATAIVSGYLGLALEMWTNGDFGNTLAHPATADYRFENRPHATTAKALLICSARPYPMSTLMGLTRFTQGWGFPDVQRLYEMREKAVIVNETKSLEERKVATFRVMVAAEEAELRMTLVYAEPGATGSVSGTALLNNLDLKATAPDGQNYFGNHHLMDHLYSASGGGPDEFNTVENIFIEKPKAGQWTVTVFADVLTTDSYEETKVLDADFAMVVLGATASP